MLFRSLGVAHRANIEDNIRLAIATLTVADKQQEAERNAIKALTTVSMTRDGADMFFKELVGLKEGSEKKQTRMVNQVESLNELFTRGTGNEGSTRWDAFNAVTEFVDHSRTIRLTGGRNAAEARFEASLLGSGEAVKARAFDMLSVA